MQEALSAHGNLDVKEATEFDIVKKVEVDVQYEYRREAPARRKSLNPRLLLDGEKRYP